jgi:ATP-dependent protease ClpP protease subunit
MAVFVKRILFFIAINYKNKSLLKYCWNKQKMEEYMNTATWKEGISAVSDMEDENINGSNNTDNILPDDGVSNGRNAKSDEKREKDEKRDQKISDYGQVTLDENNAHHKIHLLSIIGEIEGHENLNSSQKTTKYEHVLPQLAAIADSTEVDGLLVLLNTVGGDVESGLAIAEMITTLGKPSVSLVLGGGHSIGVPLAVATDYSYIVPSGTMIIHPVRMSGTVIGAKQTYDYFKRIQDRILGFVAGHSGAPKEKLESMMMNTGMLTKDLGTILVGQEAVDCGLIDEVGGIKDAMQKLHALIDNSK